MVRFWSGDCESYEKAGSDGLAAWRSTIRVVIFCCLSRTLLSRVAGRCSYRLGKRMMQLIELLAVISAGIYGVLLARRKEMDFVGVFSVAFITAFGGGTLRDLLLDRTPMFWIKHDHYPVIVFLLALAAVLMRNFTGWQRWAQRWLFLPDAFGLGLFSVVGAGYALEAQTSMFVAALFGVITGIMWRTSITRLIPMRH